MKSVNLAKPQFYYHSPNVDDQFIPADALHSPGPAIGLPMHQDPELFERIRQHGVAPDWLFRHGLAAPPLPGNESGLRHYVAQMDVDPQRIMNLDLPLEGQTQDVRTALAKMGIRTGDSLLGEPRRISHALWENAMANTPAFAEDNGWLPKTSLIEQEKLGNYYVDGTGQFDRDPESLRNLAAETMYQQLQDANLPMGVRTGTGLSAGSVYAKPVLNERGEKSPSKMIQEARIFQPDKLEIIRRLAVPGAIGVGAAAAGGTASADDRYGDRLSKFSQPEPDNSFFGMLGQAGDYLQGKASGAAKYVGDRFSDDLTPEDMAAFQANPTREMRHFNAVVDEAMQMPVMRIKDEGGSVITISPAQYFDLAKKSGIPGLSEQTVNNAIASIKGMPFDENDKIAINLRDAFLNQMRSNLPGRYEPGATDTEFDAGATPEQAAEFDKAGPAESRYRLTPQGEQGYQSERAYNLFSTFQNGTHRPIGANNSGKALAAVGGLALDMFGDTQGAAQTYNLAANRFNTPQGRMNEALQWWYTGQPDGTAGDSLGGAKYPSLSSTTFEGVTTKMTNADNFLPRYNQQLSERYLYNLDMPEANRATLDRMRDDFYRTTPRYPAGADPKEVRGIIRELKDLDTEARQYSSVEYPSFVKNYTMSPEAFGGATHDFTGKTVMPDKPLAPVKPTYLSPFGEMVANYPRDLADMQGIAELGLAGVTGGGSLIGSLINERSLARGAAKVAKSLARGGGRIGTNTVGETPQNAAIMQVNLPDQHPGLFTPPEYHPLVTDFGGNPVRADDPNYEMYKPSAYQKRDDRLRRILEAGTTMYGLPPARMAPAQRYTSPMAQ